MVPFSGVHVLNWEGKDALAAWEEIFGLDYTPQLNAGLRAPGKRVRFEGPLDSVAPQTILTDFLVDRIYPVTPRAETVPVARSMQQVVGTCRASARGGSATFLGYRPRDDQSASLGYETRNWFEVLRALGAYPATGRFPAANDNPQVVSRTTGTLACTFPNGAVAIARHFRRYPENWPGGFARKAAEDKAYVEAHPLPGARLALDGLRVAGHEVSYQGSQVVVLRTDAAGELIALAALDGQQITIDGRTFKFADQPLPRIVWGPVAKQRRVPGGAIFQLQVHGTGTVRIPRGNLPQRMELVAEGPTPGSRGTLVPAHWEGDKLVLEITARLSGRQLWGVPLP